MPRGVQQVEHVLLSVVLVIQLYGMRLYSNSFFPFQVHTVQYLCFHIALLHGMGELKKTVSQSAFSVIYMGNNAEIPDVFHKWGKGKYNFYLCRIIK